MILLSALLFLLWGEHAGGFTFNGDLCHLAVAANRVYISTEERLYQLNHDLTLVQSLTQRGLLTAAERVEDQHFHRVSETDDGKGMQLSESTYCCRLFRIRVWEQIQVGAPFNSNKTVSFLVDVKKTEKTETYILTGSEQHKDQKQPVQCPYEEYAVKLHNTNNDQKGEIFSKFVILLAVDKNFHTACPRVLYRASDDRKVFPKIHLDQVDHKHVYLPFRNQVERVPVSKCSTYTTVQDCWSAQDPYCVWCSSKKSCTFEDDCKDSDWVAIPDDSRQQKMISYKVVMDSPGQITLNIQTHVTAGQQALSNFACEFSATSSLRVSLKMRLGATHLLEQLQIVNCFDIRGPPTSVL
ncbi:hypothetical protein L3Q82_009557 [Scortum barcoo]|uniref:Uncharacterized protein n=1 Tax=Scortum barcoo TaxID=214431 RepID=A0ACB8WGF0_9TELE|nr:hypothetical protein L3Q82_009557 [Scortum barcoo]